MRGGKVAAVIVEVVLLLAVIGQRLPRNLSSRDTATIREYGKKQRIHGGALLKDIKDSLGTFIHKRNGADLLVNITNDAWFGKTSAPSQHFSIAVFRAVENRVFVARAANTGISGFIDPRGKILKQGGVFTEEAINGKVRLMEQRSFYTLYGDVFAWVCSAISLLLLGYVLTQKRNAKGSDG